MGLEEARPESQAFSAFKAGSSTHHTVPNKNWEHRLIKGRRCICATLKSERKEPDSDSSSDMKLKKKSCWQSIRSSWFEGQILFAPSCGLWGRKGRCVGNSHLFFKKSVPLQVEILPCHENLLKEELALTPSSPNTWVLVEKPLKAFRSLTDRVHVCILTSNILCYFEQQKFKHSVLQWML